MSITKKQILKKLEYIDEVISDTRFTDTHRINQTKFNIRGLRDELRKNLDPWQNLGGVN